MINYLKGVAMQVNASSMMAHQQWANTNAHNIANVNTEGFARRESTLSERAPEGVQAQSRATESQSELARDMSDQIAFQRGHEANKPAIQTQDQMLGTLLNMKV
jgi:flagellar hook protein FlgE